MGTILGKGFAQAQVNTEFIAHVPKAQVQCYELYVLSIHSQQGGKCNKVGTVIMGHPIFGRLSLNLHNHPFSNLQLYLQICQHFYQLDMA